MKRAESYWAQGKTIADVQQPEKGRRAFGNQLERKVLGVELVREEAG